MTNRKIAQCKICNKQASYIGKVDFNKSGNDHFEGKRLFSPSSTYITYYRCNSCGFMFSKDFNNWKNCDFKEKIYNSEYIKADPPFEFERPEYNSKIVYDYFSKGKENISLLDFGSGNSKFIYILNKLGFNCKGYDPFYEKLPLRKDEKFDIITCFEVVEHATEQYELFDQIFYHLKSDGVLLFSTLLQPDNIEDIGVNWWYVCPRNGHISFHTPKSLDITLKKYGYLLTCITNEYHVAYKNKLTYALDKEIIENHRNK